MSLRKKKQRLNTMNRRYSNDIIIMIYTVEIMP